jgi:hypothetical protein
VAVCTGVLVACLPNSLKKEAEDQVGDSHEMNNANSDDNSNRRVPRSGRPCYEMTVLIDSNIKNQIHPEGGQPPGSR